VNSNERRKREGEKAKQSSMSNIIIIPRYFASL
jgi:hypothetical protein